jgi:hypothetical protein
MTKKWFLVFALAGASIASAKTFTVTFDKPTEVGTAQLKPGEYKLTLNGSMATFADSHHHTAAQASVKVENLARKFDYTAVETKKTGDATRLEGIELGGTRLQLEFN